MNIEKPQPRGSKRCLLVGAAALFVLFAAAPAAFADPPATDTETRVARVSLADLDLTTPAGAREALARLTLVARHLCRQMGDEVRASNRSDVSACVRETLADTIRQINAPSLAALGQ